MKKPLVHIDRSSPGGRRHRAAAAFGPIALCVLTLVPGPGVATAATLAEATTTMASYGYRPGPEAPGCTRAQVHLAISLPPGAYTGGSPVPFKVSLANVSSKRCSVTALQPPSGLATKLVYARIFDNKGREVLIPDHFPGLRVRMLPHSLGPHQTFSYACTWNGRIWSAVVTGHPVGIDGMAAPAGRYTAVAVLANPAIRTIPLHFVLKSHSKAAG